MNNKCKFCGLVNFVGSEECKRCKKSLKFSTESSQEVRRNKEQTNSKLNSNESSNKTSSDLKTALKVIPVVAFGVPLFMVMKDRMSGEYVKPGGYVETLQTSILIFCTIGLLVSFVVLIMTKKK